MCALAACLLLPGAERSTGTARLEFVGDILLDRGVARAAERYGWGHMLDGVRPTLASADIVYGNLECPVSTEHETIPKKVRFRGDCRGLAVLSEAGFDVLDLANNHSTDCGRGGLVETMDRIARLGMSYSGAASTQAEAEAAIVLDANGVRVAYLGFSDWLPEGLFIRADRPTIAVASPESVRTSVSLARTSADVVVVAFHWGVEFHTSPSERQRDLARAAVAAGADVVIGHHPHVLQGTEWLTGPGDRRALVAYSLGNFLFDQYRQRADESGILVCDVSRGGLEHASFVPVRIMDAQPMLDARAHVVQLGPDDLTLPLLASSFSRGGEQPPR